MIFTPRASIICFLLMFCNSAWAQGQDSTPGERYLLVMAELLPGIYDNANQHYFDKRRQLDDRDRHSRINTTITRINAPAFGEYVFLWVNSLKKDETDQISYRIASLHANGADDEIVMRHYFRMTGAINEGDLASLTPADLQRTEGCDYYFKRRAGQFHGVQKEQSCRFNWNGSDVYTVNTIELSESELWFKDHKYSADNVQRLTGVASGEPYWLERSRIFHCYADIPGVGGGKDIPFERYENFTLHDKGGVHWFTTRDTEQRSIGIALQSITWHVLNEDNGNFNRDSLVLYTMEKMPDGNVKDHGYAFTEPQATRIGNNMKWMLVNCAMTARDRARPEM